jgi:alcohol dehydrogenase (NADP+)
MQAHAYAAQSAKTPLAPFSFERREVGPHDVAIDILFCGVCHSDLHTARGEWAGVKFPSVPGHEIIGRVAAVGDHVGNFKVGDKVGVGCMVDSCQHCDPCKRGLEQYCEVGMTGTYNGPEQGTGANTYGGYSDKIVVREEFVLRLPDGLDPAAAAPLLCAGITTYSPLRHWNIGPGKKVGVVGLGGLGHMAVKLAKAMGAEVTLFTTSPGKEDDARRLGAAHVVLSKDAKAMETQARTFDLIINTVAVPMDLDPYINALALDGTMVLVGAPPSAHKSPAVFPLLMARRSIAGSGIGGIPETQEMLDFCAEHGVASDIEIIPIQSIEDAYARMLKSDVKYRFVIDMQSLKDEAAQAA